MNCSKENDAYKQLREAANIPNLEKDTLALQVIDPYSKQLASIKQNRKENYDASPNKFERCNCSMVHIDEVWQLDPRGFINACNVEVAQELNMFRHFL